MAEQAAWTGGYELPTYPFVPPPELADGRRRRYPIVIVGGGLSGLTLACDLANRGVESVLLDEDDTIGVRGASSRGIVYAQKTLEVFAHLGTYPRIREKGITWSEGKTLAGHDVVYSFSLQSANASEQPPFINLQQFYIEWFLVDRIAALGRCDLRWRNRVTKVTQTADCATVAVETPAGAYTLEAEWLIDATGVNSPIRQGFGLETRTSRIVDRWCITDVRFKEHFPTERWTWVEAPFNENRAVWQHLMGDDVWRLDYQMAGDCDPEYVSRREVAEERLRAHLGDIEFELVWVGPYAYRDHLLDDFRLGRVFFIGDAAHVVSPFGARGGNSGIQDAYNLGWKLALVTKRRRAAAAPRHLQRRTAAGGETEPRGDEPHVALPRAAIARRAHAAQRRDRARARARVRARAGEHRTDVDRQSLPGLARGLRRRLDRAERADHAAGRLAVDARRARAVGRHGLHRHPLRADARSRRCRLRTARGDRPAVPLLRLRAGRDRRSRGQAENRAQGRARHLRPHPPRPVSRRARAERECGAGRGLPPESALPMTTDPNIPDPDGFYAALVAAHEGLTEAQSVELNARLVFLLANQVGSQGVLLDCVAAARKPFVQSG